jgi:hypothetical protein
MVQGRTWYASFYEDSNVNAELTLVLSIEGVVAKGMRLICTLNADLSALAGALRVQTGKRGKTFYRVDYNVCVYFGGTQLRANLQWKEDVRTFSSSSRTSLTKSQGVLREGPVSVMPYVS